MADDRPQLYQSPCPSCQGSGRESGHCLHKRGLNSKLHLAVDAHGMLVRLAVTEGTVADCSQALTLIESMAVECRLGDRAYDAKGSFAAEIAC